MQLQPMSEIVGKVRQIEIRTRRLVDDAVGGHYHSVFRGRGIDFDEVRDLIESLELVGVENPTADTATRPADAATR